MAQATKSTVIESPLITDINHISFSGDFSDILKTFVSVSLVIKDENGDKFQDVGVTVEDIPGLQGILTAFQNSVLPKIVEKVEADLGVTFV